MDLPKLPEIPADVAFPVGLSKVCVPPCLRAARQTYGPLLTVNKKSHVLGKGSAQDISMQPLQLL